MYIMCGSLSQNKYLNLNLIIPIGLRCSQITPSKNTLLKLQKTKKCKQLQQELRFSSKLNFCN